MNEAIIYRTLKNNIFEINEAVQNRKSFISQSGIKVEKEKILKTYFSNLITWLSKKNIQKNDLVWIRMYSLEKIITLKKIQQEAKNNDINVAFSLIRQKPLNINSDLSSQGLIVSNHTPKKLINISKLKTQFPDALSKQWREGNEEYILISGLTSSIDSNTYKETEDIINKTDFILNEIKLPSKEKILRTWLYVDDIDNNYAAVVKARNIFFKQNNFLDRYFVSTGIGTINSDKKTISIDILLSCNHNSNLNHFIDAPKLLPHAKEYGVKFERALSYKNSCFNHCLIAGTASINNKGKVLYVGDPKKQTKRAFKIIKKLLDANRQKIENMETLTLYLRNENDLFVVKKVCRKIAPKTPVIFLKAPVCRPKWLVEIEGEATTQRVGN